jgi:hypothetical protein
MPKGVIKGVNFQLPPPASLHLKKNLQVVLEPTSFLFVRSDFPFTNPLLQDKFLTLWQENGQVKMAWRDKS